VIHRGSQSSGLAVSAEGHYHITRAMDQEIVYVVQTDKGQETLTPEEFSKKYGLQNNPEQAGMR
jgi:hypothetical protein